VLAGNHTYAAAKSLGWSRLAVTWVDVDDEQAARIALVDNKSNDRSGYDPEALEVLLSDLPDLSGTGWTGDELTELLASLIVIPPKPVNPDDAPDLRPEPRTKPGDVWVLGQHRVVCGDSMDPKVFDQVLLPDEKISLVWTDPPYGNNMLSAGKLSMANDSRDMDVQAEFLRASLANAYEVCRPGAMWFVMGPHGPSGRPFNDVLGELGVWRHSLVWVKQAFTIGHGDYHYRHEVIYYGWRPDGPRLVPLQDRTQDTIWEFDRPFRSVVHPTMKPVGLVERALKNASRVGDLVLDCFLGSGTMLIAAHVTGRRARCVELLPQYVDVALRRFQEAFGVVPVLESTGEERDFSG
jgi:DNA modification methylase